MLSSKRFLKKTLCIISIISLLLSSAVPLCASAKGIGGGTGTDVKPIQYTFYIKYTDNNGNAIASGTHDYTEEKTTTREGNDPQGNLIPATVDLLEKDITNYFYKGYYYSDANNANVKGSMSSLLLNSPPKATALLDGKDSTQGKGTYTVFMVYSKIPPATFTLTYHLNGGNGNIPGTKSYTEGTPVTLDSGLGLFLVDHKFTGWNTEANGSGNSYTPGEQIFMSNRNLNLYAQWTPHFTVSYNPNGGAGNIYSHNVSSTAYTTLSPHSAELNYSKAHYVFLGWNTNKDAAEGEYSAGISTTLTQSLTLYAIWKKTPEPEAYTVTYDPNGGTGNAYQETTGKNAGGKFSHTVLNNKNINLKFAKDGFLFAGWSTNSAATAGEYEAGYQLELFNSLTLYAVWLKEEEFTEELHYSFVIGYPDGSIKPSQNISREEISAVLIRTLSETNLKNSWQTTNSFPDVGKNGWSVPAISIMEGLKYVEGYTDKTFRPKQAITREEFAAIMVRYAGLDGMQAKNNYFADVSGWSKNYVNLAYENRLVEGDTGKTTFRPKDKITRAEAMTMINRVLNRQVKKENLLPDMTFYFNDNANTNTWYYATIQESANSHFCIPFMEEDGVQYEKWTRFCGTPNWILLQNINFDIQSFVFPTS